MSEVKPVETTEVPPVVAPLAEPATVEPVVEAKTEEPAPVETGAKPEELTTEAPTGEASTAEALAEAPVESPKEIEPITEGVLETKIVPVIPLFVKKHTFYFSDDAVAEDHLGEYLKKEKTNRTSHATFAHATQTGRGLLFYTKSDKTKPNGIVRLDGAEITTQGDKKFTIKSAGHELQLEASTAVLRQRWVHTLKIKISESEGIHAATAETEGFKAALEKLNVIPSVVAKEKKEEVVADETKEDKKEEKPEEGETKKEESPTSEDETPAEPSTIAAAKVEKKEEKGGRRSSSRNRLSRFSFFGKKEEKTEEKKEDEPVAEVKEETTTEPSPETTEPVATTTSAEASAPEEVVVAPTTEVPPTEATATTTDAPVEPPKEVVEETSPVTSPKSNRKSFLGGLFASKKKDEKVETPVEEAKPVEPVPEATATTETAAPALVEPVTTSEPLPDATEPKETAIEPPVEAAKETKEESAKSGGIFGSLRRDRSADGEKPRRSLSFWKKEKKPAGKEEATPIVEAEPTPEAATTEPAVTEPVKTEPATTEAAPVALPDTLSGTAIESEVRDGKIGDVVSAAVTVGGEPSRA